jgi:hypothetical protein
MALASRRTRIALAAIGIALLAGAGALAGRHLGLFGTAGNGGQERPPVPIEAPRLDVRERSRRLAQQQPLRAGDLPLGAQAPSDADAVMSLARATADEYRQQARYPNWSQPLGDGEDPLLRSQFDMEAAMKPAAQLMGNYRDRAEGGDLAIDAELEVTSAGHFHLEATLYSEDGQHPIAWAQQSAELTPGRRWLGLRFHGLILHERRIDGPYLLRFVVLTKMPDTKLQSAENALLTRAYKFTEFSDQPFNDPELLDAADRIERALEVLAADAEG